MHVLGLDSGGAACSVALWRAEGPGGTNGQCLARQQSLQRHGHGEVMIGLIDRALADAGLAPDGLDLIGVTVGPGGFTGLRLGLAAAGGLALALRIGIVGVSSFDALAADLPPVPPGTIRVMAIDSRRAEPFLRVLTADGPVGPDRWQAPEALAAELPSGPVELAGDGTQTVAEALAGAGRAVHRLNGQGQPGKQPIDPVAVARLAARHADRAQPDPPSPAYLRPPDAEPATPAG